MGRQQAMERAKGNWPDAKEIRYGGTYEKVNASYDPVKDEYRQFSLKNNPNAKVGININDSTQAFTEQILNGEKTVETRNTPSLRKYVGQRVGLVRTGNGKATVVGYATISEEIHYDTLKEFRADENRHLVQEGSKYDFKNGKYGYVLTDVEREADPYVVTEKGIVARDVDRDVQYSFRNGIITLQSTDSERASHLSKFGIIPASVDYSNISDINLEQYITSRRSSVQAGIKEIAKRLKIVNTELSNDWIDFTFTFGIGSLLKSVHHQGQYGGSYQDYVKVVSCFNDLVFNAVPIETHTDNMDGTEKAQTDLKQAYVFMSAYEDGDAIHPVQLVVKENIHNPNQLYMDVVLAGIEKPGVMESGPADTIGSVHHLLPGGKYSLSWLISKVNPADGNVLKYIPDSMLSEEQKQSDCLA